jgi:copper transport protein
MKPVNAIRCWIALVVAACALGMGAAPALAHASLSRSFPSPGAVLAQAPGEIRLWFTEPVELAFSRITLLTPDGARLPLEDTALAPEDPHQLYAPLPPLPDGVYTVDWRVVSAADGHSTSGSFAFTIGTAHQGIAAASLAQQAVPVADAAARTLNYLALAVFFGAAAFQAVVLRGAAPASVRLLMRAGWAAVGLAGVLLSASYATRYAELGLAEAVTSGAAQQFLLNTRQGHLLLARGALWAALAWPVWRGRGSTAGNITLAGSAGLLLLHTLGSHATNIPDGGIGVVVGWLHLAGAMVWIGGLGTFVVWLASRSDKAPAVYEVTLSFSNLARIAVIGLIVSGIYSSLWHIGSPEALLGTTHGRALLAKLAFFLPMLALAGYNLLIVTPRLKQQPDSRILRRGITAELTLGIAALAAAGLMTAVQPAREAYAQQQTATASAPYFGMETVDNLMVHLEIVPLQAGNNTFVVSLYDASTGDMLTDATRIRMRFSHASASGRSELRPEAQPDGTYTAQGSNLSISGEWRVRLTISRPRQFDSVVDFSVSVH